MKRHAIVIAITLAAGLGIGSNAAHSHGAKHGGMVVEVSDLDLELVLSQSRVQLHVGGHGKPVDLSKSSARLSLLSGKQKQDIELKPAGDKFEASGQFTPTPGTKAVAVLSINGKAVTARFVVK